ncbi:dynamin-binding protein-like, partial [Saccoglossus kowalevskii]
SKIKDKDSKEDLEKELEKLESPMSPTSKIGHKEKHSKEAKDERQMAKKNYSAMNTQLLDELPKLYSLSVTLFKECVQSFIEAERDHFDATLKHLYPLLKLPMILDSTREDILDSFSLKHQDASEKMMVFSFVPRNFDKKGEKVDRKSSRKSIIGQATPPKNHHSAMQTETHRTQLLSNYGSDQLYKLSLGYTARDSMDISCNRGDMVAVIKQQDPMGGNDKWYVDNGVTQGFIASSILEPCSDVDLREAPLASISDLSNSSQSQIDYVSDEDYRQQLPEYYYSEWPFEANGPNEISLDEGTVVMIVNKHDIEGNLEWWLVDKNGIQGYVPANYLTKID